MYDTRVVVAPTHGSTLEIHDVSLPALTPHQVAVRMISSGVCHSQLHQLKRERTNPTILGHEGTGIVLAVGSQVRSVKDGDAVLLTWIPRTDESGRAAEPARVTLADGSIAAAQNVFTWATVSTADELYTVQIPRAYASAESCIVACAVMTGAGAVRNTVTVQKGESVAVFGVGGVGLSAIAAARRAGADPIIAVDISDEKLDLAKHFGATDVVNGALVDPVQRIRELTGRVGELGYSGEATAGADYAFDCIGLTSTMEQALAAARTGSLGSRGGGTAVLVGAPTTALDLNVRDVLVNEKRFVGSLGGSTRPAVDLETYLDWADAGDLDLASLVTDRFALDDINDATETLAAGRVIGRAILELGTPNDR
jgi:Zn-dependent alcohol dehydrogenase